MSPYRCNKLGCNRKSITAYVSLLSFSINLPLVLKDGIIFDLLTYR